jgi:hypothetical protein
MREPVTESQGRSPLRFVARQFLLGTDAGVLRLQQALPKLKIVRSPEMETIKLADGGVLLFDEAFFPPDVADRYFAELRDTVVWEQKPGVFGHMQPRLTASYGDEGVTYRYSGTVNVAQAWTAPFWRSSTRSKRFRGITITAC